MPAHGDGPIPARVMIVGEAWGDWETREGKPFSGPSGTELNRMLGEAGILRSDCYVSNLINQQPPNNDLGLWISATKKAPTPAYQPLRDRWAQGHVVEGYNQLLREIELVKPNVIVPVGNYALWALTGKWGILKWRGSHLTTQPGLLSDKNVYDIPKLIPTIHPAAVLREWSFRRAVVNDLRRVKDNMDSRAYVLPAKRYIIRPSFQTVTLVLGEAIHELDAGHVIWFDFDVETMLGHLECFSISWSAADSICVPLMDYHGGEGYWSAEEEAEIVFLAYKVMTHKNARVRAQNGLYDVQYTHRHWHFIPRIAQDTMISQHCLFSDQPKALHYQASLYAKHYVYWKDEGKEVDKKENPEQRWNYNCDDCVYTREVGEVEQRLVDQLGLRKQHDFQQALFWPVLKAMIRGVKVNEVNANRLAMEVQEQISIRESFMEEALGMQVNIASPKQMRALFYEDFAQPVIMSRPKKGVPAHPTCDDEALQKIGAREPLLRPITNSIADIRTLGKFLGDFILARRDADGRMRCSFNIGGSESGKSAPKTYRLSSSMNAFGSGANLQTIPSEKSKSVGKWEQRQHFSMIGDPYKLPNLRSMFMPDPGYEFFDIDLDRADLQVFAWDADLPLMKQILKSGADVHLMHAYMLEGKEPPALDELVESHPRYPDHRGPLKHAREFAKVFCHATDYYGKARTISAATGRTVHEIDRAQKRYLSIHPRIPGYWRDLMAQVQAARYVENRFGYRWYIFNRIDESLMGEIVSWRPQSTVSIIINRIWMNLFQDAPEAEWDMSLDHLMKLCHRTGGIEVLLQVHDSLAGQYPIHSAQASKEKIMKLSRIVVPYEDPLVIPTGIGTSRESWGAC